MYTYINCRSINKINKSISIYIYIQTKSSFEHLCWLATARNEQRHSICFFWSGNTASKTKCVETHVSQAATVALSTTAWNRDGVSGQTAANMTPETIKQHLAHFSMSRLVLSMSPKFASSNRLPKLIAHCLSVANMQPLSPTKSVTCLLAFQWPACPGMTSRQLLPWAQSPHFLPWHRPPMPLPPSLPSTSL